jgi:putative transposase
MSICSLYHIFYVGISDIACNEFTKRSTSTAWRKKEPLLYTAFLGYHNFIRSDHLACRVEELAMPGPKPPAVPLSEEERQALHTMIRAHKTPQHLSFRAHVILLLAEGLTAPDVARRLGTTRATVRRWRRHWLTRHGCAVPERLQDAARPGAPATFSAEQWCQLIALACQPPEASGRPISHWTPRELADEARKRAIVPSISARHVGRFLKSGRSQAAPESVLAQCGA